MWASKLSTNFSQNISIAAPKSISYSKNFSSRTSYFTFNGINYTTFNKSFRSKPLAQLNFQQRRGNSTTGPTKPTEPEPIVVDVPETQPKADILARTTWVYSFSGLLVLVGAAIGLIFDSFVNNSNPEERNQNLEESDEIVEGLQFLRLLPLKLMAEKMSDMAKTEYSPEKMKNKLKTYMNLYKVSLNGVEKQDIGEYKTFEEFFTRKYSPKFLEDRFNFFSALTTPRDNFAEPLLSPVQGRVMSIQKITSEKHKEYVKDEWYSAKQFLGFNPFEEAQQIQNERIEDIENTLGRKVVQVPKKDMYIAVLYLGPGDYHRFHAPANWTAHKRIYYSGNYYPVRPSYLNFFHYKSLLGTNERVVLSGEWRHGFFSFIPVGATNVGSIHLTREPEFDNTTLALEKDREVVQYPEPVEYNTGDEIGYFSLGSTVVLVFEYNAGGSVAVNKFQKVQVGTPLIVPQKDYATEPQIMNLEYRSIEEHDAAIMKVISEKAVSE